MLFVHTETLCLSTNKILGVTSTIMYILMLEGTCMFFCSFALACKLFLTLVRIRWYGVLGIFDVAIKHLLEVIACSHQSLTTQSMFLNDFFHFVQVIDQLGYGLHQLYQTFVSNFFLFFVNRVQGKSLMYTSFNFLFSTCHHSEL